MPIPQRVPTYVLLGLIALTPAPESPGLPSVEQPVLAPARSADDPRLRRLLRASDAWRRRPGPSRRVVDQVVLVPDEATWLAAVSTWDRGHWFPVLIEDVEYTLKFLRAFRPARVVRYRGDSARAAGGADGRWAAALGAVGRAWDVAEAPDDDAPRGDRPPVADGPPGVVGSHAESPALLGAVALAAGRFQPLLRVEPEAGLGFGDLAPTHRAIELARRFQLAVSEAAPSHDVLGDDCDFLTIAGDYPYKYEGGTHTFQEGPAAFDDLLGRDLRGPAGSVRARWAYTGRLLGDSTTSVYRAMAALFLPGVDSAVLINGYGGGKPWSDFDTAPAAELLRSRGVKVDERRDAGVAAWHEAFDPVNRAPLAFLNSSGNPTDFNLRGGAGHTGDVPRTGPVAIHMIHSFSAADPRDPGTIAGRWLANGAFAYFGSVHEPYLIAFRPPGLVAELLARGVPLGAAVRLTPDELGEFGSAWRLVYLGDPLYVPRLGPEPPLGRLDDWGPVSGWTVYGAEPAPAAEASATARLGWAVRSAIDDARGGREPSAVLVETLLGLRREELRPADRPVLIALLTDTLMELDRCAELEARLGGVPAGERTGAARRWLETARMVAFQRAVAADDWRGGVAWWGRVLIEPSTNEDLKKTLTRRLATLAKGAARRREWASRLGEAARALPKGAPLAAFLEQERAKLDSRDGS